METPVEVTYVTPQVGARTGLTEQFTVLVDTPTAEYILGLAEYQAERGKKPKIGEAIRDTFAEGLVAVHARDPEFYAARVLEGRAVIRARRA